MKISYADKLEHILQLFFMAFGMFWLLIGILISLLNTVMYVKIFKMSILVFHLKALLDLKE